MIITSKDDLNLIFKLPFGKDLILNKLRFNSEEIEFDNRIARVYMDAIGFKPYKNGDKIYTYKAKCNDSTVEISHRIEDLDGRFASVSCCEKLTEGSNLIKDDVLLNDFTFIIPDKQEEALYLRKYKIHSVKKI